MPDIAQGKRTSAGFPLYGSVYDVTLDPVVGSEIGKRRPALIVSNNLNNEYASTVTIVPCTSQSTSKVYPFEVLVKAGIAGLTKASRLKTNQIRTVDKGRLVAFRGVLPVDYLEQVEKALKVHLNLR